MASLAPSFKTGFRFRVEFTSRQRELAAQTGGACRWLYNWALDYRQQLWLAMQSSGATKLAEYPGMVHVSGLLAGLKEEFPWLAEVPHHALQQTLRDLDDAFTSFFEGRTGFPKFKKRDATDRFRFPDPTQFELDTCESRVRLPKFGWVRFRRSRWPFGEVRNVTVTQDGDDWFVSFCCEGDYRLPNQGEAAVGLDAGVTASVTLSTGEVISFPVPSPKERRRARFLQRQLARRQKGSARRRRTLARLSQLRRHHANRVTDAQHKLSTRLATTHRAIAIEGLSLASMTASARGTVAAPGSNVARKAGLNRAMLANAHGRFRTMLRYKCERSGAQLVEVPAAYTSQTCSRCQHCAPANRESQAVFRCQRCGLQLNADHNAALNIRQAALSASTGGLSVAAQGGPVADELRTPRRPTKRLRGIPVQAAQAA